MRGRDVGVLNLLLWAGGIGLIALGYLRAKAPYARYQALREQDANVKRYEQWRGGVRDSSSTGASVAMGMLRRQARLWLAVSGLGVVLVFAGFFLK
jgi:hypothetical protein